MPSLSEQTAASVLTAFSANWPWFRPDELTAGLWAESLHGIDRETATAAVARTIREAERPPTIAGFLAVCRLVARETSSRALPAVNPSQNVRGDSGRVLHAINVAWNEAFAARPDHNHHRGADQCPRCTTTEQFVKEAAADIDAAIRERHR